MLPKLIIRNGSQAGREIELTPGVHRIGRDPEAGIHIPEPGISGVHCELHVADIGVAFLDFDSTNGTFLNRSRVSKGVLQNGDLLTLGDIDFAVQLPEVTIAIPPQQVQESPGAAFLEDGAPACFTHRDAPAAFACTKCENWWCNDCVRTLKRLSGAALVFCPECDAPCVPISAETAPRRKGFLRQIGERARKNLFGRLGDTLHLGRKR